MNFKLEIIGFTIQGCVAAQNAGANRIELCDNATEGGTTPSYGFIKSARKKLSIELYPIIRPRSGDFLYSDDEFEIMKEDILVCKKLGCDGIVTGLLHADGTVDKIRTSQLVSLAYPMGVTFHRAFDRTANALQAMEDIIETGCERILTSGLMPQAEQGISTIAALVNKAAWRIIIMPGSGVRSANIAAIAAQTGALEFHSSARSFTKSKMEFVSQYIKEDLQILTADATEISAMADILKGL